MNIFWLDNNPFDAARDLDDRRVIKMVLESAQILSMVHHKLNSPFAYPDDFYRAIYKPTHPNHPCVKWAAKTSNNYTWLWCHFQGLSLTYYDRFGKNHKTWMTLQDKLVHLPLSIELGPLTPPAQAMPEKYKYPDPVVAYRHYYIREKLAGSRWTNCNPPAWINI